jgi:hypothetical protein
MNAKSLEHYNDLNQAIFILTSLKERIGADGTARMF